MAGQQQYWAEELLACVLNYSITPFRVVKCLTVLPKKSRRWAVRSMYLSSPDHRQQGYAYWTLHERLKMGWLKLFTMFVAGLHYWPRYLRHAKSLICVGVVLGVFLPVQCVSDWFDKICTVRGRRGLAYQLRLQSVKVQLSSMAESSPIMACQMIAFYHTSSPGDSHNSCWLFKLIR